MNVAVELAGGLGTVLGMDPRNKGSLDQCFCLGLPSGEGWKTSIAMDNTHTGEEIVITVDYGNLPICCRVCLSTNHMVKDCPRRGTKTLDEGAGFEEVAANSEGRRGDSNSPPSEELL